MFLTVECVTCGKEFLTTDIFALPMKEVYCPHCGARFWIKKLEKEAT